MNKWRRPIEAILFLADEPISSSDLAVLMEVPAAEVEAELSALRDAHEQMDSGLVLREVAGGWRLATHPDAGEYLERFVSEHRSVRLTQAALETLAIIAYRQPVSRVQIADIRGVSSEGVLKTLIVRDLIEEVGRDPGPGQAIFYGTTPAFLERMGLRSLEDLPPLPEFMPDIQAVEKMESGLGPSV